MRRVALAQSEVAEFRRLQPLLGVDLHAALELHGAEAEVQVGDVGGVALLAHGCLDAAGFARRLADPQIRDGQGCRLQIRGEVDGAVFARMRRHGDLALAEIARVEAELGQVLEIGHRADRHRRHRSPGAQIAIDVDFGTHSIEFGRTAHAETGLRRHERQLPVAQRVPLDRLGRPEILDVARHREILTLGRALPVQRRRRHQANADVAGQRFEVDRQGRRFPAGVIRLEFIRDRGDCRDSARKVAGDFHDALARRVRGHHQRRIGDRDVAVWGLDEPPVPGHRELGVVHLETGFALDVDGRHTVERIDAHAIGDQLHEEAVLGDGLVLAIERERSDREGELHVGALDDTREHVPREPVARLRRRHRWPRPLDVGGGEPLQGHRHIEADALADHVDPAAAFDPGAVFARQHDLVHADGSIERRRPALKTHGVEKRARVRTAVGHNDVPPGHRDGRDGPVEIVVAEDENPTQLERRPTHIEGRLRHREGAGRRRPVDLDDVAGDRVIVGVDPQIRPGHVDPERAVLDLPRRCVEAHIERDRRRPHDATLRARIVDQRRKGRQVEIVERDLEPRLLTLARALEDALHDRAAVIGGEIALDASPIPCRRDIELDVGERAQRRVDRVVHVHGAALDDQPREPAHVGLFDDAGDAGLRRFEVEHDPVVVAAHMRRFGRLADHGNTVRAEPGIGERPRAFEHADGGRRARLAGNDLKCREARTEQVLVDLDVRGHDRDRRARLADQCPDRRKTHLQGFHAHFGAGCGVLVNHGAELNDRPRIALEGQRHVAQFQLGICRHRRNDHVAHLRRDEGQRNGMDQQRHIERGGQGQRDTEQPGGGKADGSGDRALADRLSWWRRWLQFWSAGMIGEDPKSPRESTQHWHCLVG